MGLLMKFFKKNAFKDWQLRVIKAILGGKNALIVQPTGSGKSLCFQFPSTITAKMTIVLLPTVSLIMDQVKALETTGLRVTYLGTMQNDRTVMGKIAQAQYDVVLSTPESFFDKLGQPKPVFRSLAVQCKLGLVAIDEAHLVRTWRTFRYVHTKYIHTFTYTNTIVLMVFQNIMLVLFFMQACIQLAAEIGSPLPLSPSHGSNSYSHPRSSWLSKTAPEESCM